MGHARWTGARMNPEPLWAWQRERHAIFLRRAAGQPRPWTADPILRAYRFCNVFRELDRVTVWIRENIREPFAEHPNLWLMLAIARWINWPDTLAAAIATPHAWPVDDSFKPDALAAVMQQRQDNGQQVYTGAYMIRAENDKRQASYRWTKHQYIARIVIGELWKVRDQIDAQLSWTKSLQQAHRIFTPFRCWGPFMSYEVVTDLRHTRYLRAATDTMTWANAGPGALRGLNRLEGRSLNARRSEGDACAAMRAPAAAARLAAAAHRGGGVRAEVRLGATAESALPRGLAGRGVFVAAGSQRGLVA